MSDNAPLQNVSFNKDSFETFSQFYKKSTSCIDIGVTFFALSRKAFI